MPFSHCTMMKLMRKSAWRRPEYIEENVYRTQLNNVQLVGICAHVLPKAAFSQPCRTSVQGDQTDFADDTSDLESWKNDLNNLPRSSNVMGPPCAVPRGGFPETASKSTWSSSVNYQGESNNNNDSTTNNNNTLRSQNQHTTSQLLQQVTNNPSGRNTHLSSNNNQTAAFDRNDTSKGNVHASNYINVLNNNINSETSRLATHDVVHTMSVKAVVTGQHQNISDLSARQSECSPIAVPGVDCDTFNVKTASYGRFGLTPTNGKDCTETRRRNYSSSSLPLSLMTATIEEVEDAECVNNTYTQGTSRSHSYGGNVAPKTKISYRALRREARVSSLSSPPRTRRLGPTLGLVRSASDNTNRLTSLRDVDIIGESFESRYPWQKDFGVQCEITNDPDMHPSLKRAMSGPAMYTYFRSLSLASSSSPCSSPPLTIREFPLRHCNNSSQSNFINRHQPASHGDSAALPYRQATMHRSNRTNKNTNMGTNKDYSMLDKTKGGLLYNRRADFKKKPRPSSVGAADSIRYHHELATFRELHNARRERKSDPQLAISPGVCRQMALVFADDLGSASDLESILENPGDRPWDISRQTSLASIDLEDDAFRYAEDSGHLDPLQNCTDYLIREDVLPSPTLCPKKWATFDEDEDIDDSDDSFNTSDDQGSRSQKRLRGRKQPRRLSSGSITSDAESESTEPDPPVVRRGRRAAIYETKNCGDVSPTTLSPEASPSNSCDEGEGASNIAERLRRRRSSVDLAMNIYPGDLLVQEHHKKLIKRNTIADFYAAGKQPNGVPSPPGVGTTVEGVDVTKKGRQSFSLLKLMKTRSKESLTKIGDILKRLKPSEFKDNHLAAYKSLHWSDLIASSDKQQCNQTASISDTERKRREAVWELFKSECVFLIDHLMVLKHCFLEPLKKVQVEGSLMYAEPQDLFGNLDELSYVSYTFCKDFISALLKDMSITDFGRTNVLLKAFQRFSAHSRDGAVYHSYCLNYTNALAHLEKLRANSEFAEFEKWCEQDPRCNRLQLTDLLVAPMQHCTKLPLLLHNVRKYTANEDERQQVTQSIEKVETSLKQLEEKMRWIKNFERVQEIQRQIVWPAVSELDPRCVIPESLKTSLSKQPCEQLLACPKRQLLHEGQVTLVETPKPIDVHLFLFDDILLITKVKKIPRKLKQLSSEMQSSGQSDRVSYIVLRQPLALDRFMLHDISPSDAAASGLKHCFALVHISRYQQITGVFTFQAACDVTKSTWLTQIRDAMDGYARAASCQNGSFRENGDPKIEETELARAREECLSVTPSRRLQNGHSISLRNVPTKSRSMDAVYI